MAEFIMNNLWVVWLALAVIFVVVELLTTALVSVWFVPGAVATALLSMLVKNITIQILMFLVISGVVIFLSKKVFRRTRVDQLTNPNELLIGKTAVVKEGTVVTEAKVLLGDVYWRAVSDVPLAEGELVTVIAVNGNMLTVEKQREAVKES